MDSSTSQLLQMTHTYFHVSPGIYSCGDIKQKGRFGALLESDRSYVLADPDGEFLREKVRLSHYPNKPSRLRSSFVFESLQDAQNFRNRRGDGERIYRVSFEAEPPSIHRVCYTAWTMTHFDLMVQAHEFWSGALIYPADTELFAEADLIIGGEV